MSNDVPEHVIEVEKELWHWGSHGPVDCIAEAEFASADERRRAFDSELQYHLGAYTAAQSACNVLYSLEDINDRYYDELHPPWMADAMAYREQLSNRVDDDAE